jgi:hypothetical protein
MSTRLAFMILGLDTKLYFCEAFLVLKPFLDSFGEDCLEALDLLEVVRYLSICEGPVAIMT